MEFERFDMDWSFESIHINISFDIMNENDSIFNISVQYSRCECFADVGFIRSNFGGNYRVKLGK